MKLKKISLIIIYFLGITILQSCIKDPELVSIDKIEFVGNNDSGIVVRVNSTFNNPNKFDLKATSVLYSFYINDEKLGEGKIDEEIILKKKNKTQVSSVNTIDLKKMSAYFIDNGLKDTIPLRINIEANFSSLKLPVKRQFVTQMITKDIVKYFLSEEQLQKSISITKLRPVKIRPQSSEFKFNVVFNNQFPIDFELSEINLAAYSNEQKTDTLGNTLLTKHVIIHQKQETQIPMSINIHNINMLQSAFSGILTGARNIYMSGFITVHIDKNIYKLPINQSFNFN